jgi:hypothetical protein
LDQENKMTNESKPDTSLDATIDELAEKLKHATETFATRAHHLAEGASVEARELATRSIATLRAASAKLEQWARKIEESQRT